MVGQIGRVALIYTHYLTRVKQTASGKLLIAGSSAQCCDDLEGGVGWVEGSRSWGCMCMHRANSGFQAGSVVKDSPAKQETQQEVRV